MTLTGDADALEERTIRDFGEQWTRYQRNEGYYASVELLRDIVEPLLPLDEIAGKRVAEIGSGSGRIVSMLLDAGVDHVLAIEPSSAYAVLRANVGTSRRVTFLNIAGDELPASADLDVVLSIGVIHHIPDPEPALRAAFEALRPGGKILIWLYGREGNELYLALAQPLRAVTRRLPHWALAGLVRALDLPLAIMIRLARAHRVPLPDYLNNYLGKLGADQRRLVIYDQLNPAYAHYYTRTEARAVLERAGFVNVQLHHRHGYSWTVRGEKPQASAGRE
ncbi:MAG TPA: class I SAM-dependent methyltransferase [Burkholderiales bacterium]|nr:class I SAM-dependent methyltransferase [Burkholderiales bacterium]